MAIALALGAAIAYGASDFTGGLLSRSMRVLVVIFLSQFVCVAILLVAIPVWDGEYSASAIGWGLGAGVAGVAGASLLYRGLAIGRMSVVAPITGVLAAAVPVAFGLATGERPGAIALMGGVVGIVAVVIVSRAPEPPATEAVDPHRGLLEALGAGAGFGFFFVLLERSPSDSGIWPLVGTRVSMIALLGLVLVIAGIRIEVPGGMAAGLVGLGVLNISSDLLFLLATRHGLLSVVAVLTALYPASTVVLARLVLHERIAGLQSVGLGVAGVSVVMIAVGS